VFIVDLISTIINKTPLGTGTCFQFLFLIMTEKKELGKEKKDEKKLEQKSQKEDHHAVCSCKNEKKEIEHLRDELTKKNQAVLDLTRTAQYVQAEFENYKKRVDREKEGFTQFAAASLLKDILPLIDNLELAIKHKENKEDFCKGIELTYAAFISLLESKGITLIDTSGLFNPEQHEVLLTEKSDKPDGTILEELQKGYLLHGKVLRPAKVKAAKS